MTAPSYTRRVFVGLTSSPKTPRASITWTELTDRMLSAQFRRGKSDLGGDFEPGAASIVLKNEDRLLDPDYDAGLVYRGDGLGLPGCPVKIVVTVGATDTILWFGYLGLEGWPVVRTVGVDSTVTLNAMTQTAWMATQALPSSPWAAGVIGLDPDWWVRGGADTTSLSGGDHLPDSISEGTTDQYAVVSGTGTVTIGSGLVNDDQDPAMEVGSGVRILSAGSDISPVTWGGGTGTKTQMVASCIWKADAQLVDHAVMSLFYDPTNHFRWRVYCDPYGQLVIVMTNAGGTVDLAFDVAPDNPADPDGRWDDGNPHIVTVKFVGSSKLALWVDGQHVDLTTTVPTNYGYGDLLCGTTGGYSTIDEILWWNVAISDADILILHSWFLGTGAPLKDQSFAERAASLYELAGWVYDAAEEADWHYVTGGGSPDPDLWGLGSVQSMPATLGEAQQQLVESYAGARWDTRDGWPRLRTAGALSDASYAADYATAIANLTDEQAPAGSPTPIRRGLVQKSGTLLDRVVNKAVGTYGQDRGLGVPAEDLVSITRKNQASIDLYGVRPAELTSQVTDGDYVAALVATAAAATAEPPVEIQAVQVEVNDSDSLAFVVDDLELEKLLTITDTPEVGDPWTADLQVQSEAHDWSPGRWIVTVGLALSQVRTGRARTITSSTSAGIRIGGAGLLPGSVTAKSLSPSVKAALGLSGAATTSAIPTGPAGGDLDGNYPNPTLGADTVGLAELDATGDPYQSTVLRGDDTWGLPFTASERFGYSDRAATMFLARAADRLITEMWITDSTGGIGASDPENTSCIAVYEAAMARRYNSAPRTAGFMPVQQYSLGSPVPISWDTLTGTTAVLTRGPNFANQIVGAGDSVSVTRKGTAVEIFYTAYRTGGAVVNVTINGVASGTIDSTDATIDPTAGYDSGRSVVFTRPSGVFGPIAVTLTYASGTSFEVEGAYFFAYNATTGHRVLRADKSGQTMSYLNASTGAPLLQFINNQQPKIVTLLIGCNDASTDPGASVLATRLETLVTNIRAQYTSRAVTDGVLNGTTTVTSATAVFATADVGDEIHGTGIPDGATIVTRTSATSVVISAAATTSATGVTLTIGKPWKPAIRFVFQNLSYHVPSNWLTDYRPVLRDWCMNNDVTFIDGHDAVGEITFGVDDLGFADDNLHPGDWGHRAWAQLVADHTMTRPDAVESPLLLTSTSQNLPSGAQAIEVRGATGVLWTAVRDTGAATINGAQLGAYRFGGAADAYGLIKIGALVQGVSEEAFTNSTFKTGLRFWTTDSGGAITLRAGIGGDGVLWVGASQALAKFLADQDGNITLAGNLAATVGATTGVTASTTIPNTTSFRTITETADRILTSTPTVSTTSARSGQQIKIENLSAFAVTFQDETLLAGSKLQLRGALLRTINQYESISFTYDAASGYWIEDGAAPVAPSTLYTKSTQVGTNSAAVARTLATFAVPMGTTLAFNDGDALEADFVVACASINPARNPTLTITFDGSNIYSQTLPTVLSTAASLSIRVRIVRVSTVARCSVAVVAAGLTIGAGAHTYTEITPANFTASRTLAMTGINASGTAPDMTCQSVQIRHIPGSTPA